MFIFCVLSMSFFFNGELKELKKNLQVGHTFLQDLATEPDP